MDKMYECNKDFIESYKNEKCKSYKNEKCRYEPDETVYDAHGLTHMERCLKNLYYLLKYCKPEEPKSMTIEEAEKKYGIKIVQT